MYIGGQHLCFHLEIHYRLTQPKINNEYRKKIAIVKDGINCVNKTDVLIKEMEKFVGVTMSGYQHC